MSYALLFSLNRGEAYDAWGAAEAAALGAAEAAEASDANGLGASAACWYSPSPAGASSAAGDRRLSYALLFSLDRGEAYDALGAAEAAACRALGPDTKLEVFSPAATKTAAPADCPCVDDARTSVAPASIGRAWKYPESAVRFTFDFASTAWICLAMSLLNSSGGLVKSITVACTGTRETVSVPSVTPSTFITTSSI